MDHEGLGGSKYLNFLSWILQILLYFYSLFFILREKKKDQWLISALFPVKDSHLISSLLLQKHLPFNKEDAREGGRREKAKKTSNTTHL